MRPASISSSSPAALVTALVFATLVLQVGAGVVFAAGGDLDPSFSGDGRLTTYFDQPWSIARAVALQPNGKIVIAGSAGATAPLMEFAVARYHDNGSLDTSFGGTGKVITAVGPNEDRAYAVAIQSDGKIVVAGRTFHLTDDVALVRYLPNGALDSSFGSGGIVITDVTPGQSDAARGIAIQSDGKIVIAGTSGGPNLMAVVRYAANGTLDSTFGNGGITKIDFGNQPGSEGAALTLQPDGKIVVAGAVSTPQNQFGVARLLPNGSLDLTFGGGDGSVITPFLNGARAHAVALQGDGRIVVAGEAWFAQGVHGFALARYLPNGMPDTSFGMAGTLVTTIVGTFNATARGVAVQSDGRIVAAGESCPIQDTCDFALARFQPNGALDPSFSGDGKLTSPFVTHIDAAYGLRIQPNGRIVAAGTARSGAGGDIALARYLAN